MYLIRNLIIPVQRELDLIKTLSRKLHIPPDAIEEIKIIRSALDARQKNHLKYNLTIAASIALKLSLTPEVQIYQDPQPYLTSIHKVRDPNPYIIGAGPAGLFAAVALAEKGFRPWIFDRGECLENRTRQVSDFWEKGILNEESNVQFGEGGAGAFSDGKLTSRKSDFYSDKVIENLIKFGADPNIKTNALPHLGTDGIRKIVLNIRKYLELKGCRFFWNHKLDNLKIKDDRISTVSINGEIHHPEILILAVGNAARDTFATLSTIVSMASKPFAVGFRIEHSQDFINHSFYGDQTDLRITGPAVYRLTAKALHRGVYSFCMCPGGQIITASSEPNAIVTNGMSNSSRNGNFANSAIVVTVNEKDYGKGILAGMEFQRNIERTCFNPQKLYYTPAQPAADFMKSLFSNRKIISSNKPGVFPADLNAILPTELTKAIKTGMKVFENRVPGFIGNGTLVAPETRTSSPIRFIRNSETFASVSLVNLFPCGEGSGYAGGIISSATDGYKVGSLFFLD